jgi:hypothetical protein
MEQITYWHMQMHPNDKSYADKHIHSILENRKIIGLGDWEKGESTISVFNNEMKVNDIVAIKTGEKLIALVQIIGGAYKVEVEKDKDKSVPCDEKIIDWIIYRRPIRILDWELWGRTIPQRSGTLNKCVSKEVETTKIIKEWHERVVDVLNKRGLPIKV